MILKWNFNSVNKIVWLLTCIWLLIFFFFSFPLFLNFLSRHVCKISNNKLLPFVHNADSLTIQFTQNTDYLDTAIIWRLRINVMMQSMRTYLIQWCYLLRIQINLMMQSMQNVEYLNNAIYAECQLTEWCNQCKIPDYLNDTVHAEYWLSD